MRHFVLCAVLGCGSSAPPAPISARGGTAPAVEPAPTGTCEADATQPLEAIDLHDGSRNPWRFVGPDRRVLATPYLFDNGPDYFQEGFARIVSPDGKIGFISATGAIVVPPGYDFAYPFCHGLAKTARAGKAGYLDTRGTAAIGPAGDERPLIPPAHVD